MPGYVTTVINIVPHPSFVSSNSLAHATTIEPVRPQTNATRSIVYQHYKSR